MDFFAWAGAAVSLSGLVLVLVMAWPQPLAGDARVTPSRDAVASLCDDLERIVASGRDYQSERVVVVREMDRLWTVWLDGYPHERTARSPHQARSIAETHLRTVADRRPRRGGGRVVWHARPSRTGHLPRDWRRDVVP